MIFFFASPPPQSAADELLEIAHYYGLSKGTICHHPEMTPLQLQGLVGARDFYFAPSGFKFQALIEGWTMEELFERMKELECHTYSA